jgi:hypothetical protein
MATTLNIATTLGMQSRFKESEVLLQELLGVQQQVLGAEHPNTLSTRYTMCALLYHQREYDEAEARCREVLAEQRRILGAKHPGRHTNN